ncbi:hypothetical protein SAMN05216532_3997 [Streptomyces sp. 2231.1]|uniref:hypothetical protein n=1 Tax=Streptomyces sp. 2231.1 TaxID=1855347 RepID=UPI000897E778|nr:hypothetical protein [Streptomyces sp. 2231.1]SED26508.1 hypothetical protein SAMN05216532_3997 [Streptomyces sp. 2231.1]
MSDALEKAEAAAREAAANTVDVAQIVAAVVAAQQLAQQPPQPPAPVRQEFDAKKWVVIGGVVVSVGLVGALFAAAVAIVAVAAAIGGVCATACLLILRAMWRDYTKGR